MDGNIRIPSATINMMISDRIKSVIGIQWINKPYNESMLGEYWCQVMNTDNTNIILYGISNVITIHDPEYYNMSFSTCDSTQIYKNSNKCAGYELEHWAKYDIHMFILSAYVCFIWNA